MKYYLRCKLTAVSLEFNLPPTDIGRLYQWKAVQLYCDAHVEKGVEAY